MSVCKLALCLALGVVGGFAARAADNGAGSTPPTSTDTDNYPFIQKPFDPKDGLNVVFNGSNVNSTGLNYKIDGSELDIVPRPTGNTDAGISYSDPQLIAGYYYVFQQKTDASGTVVRTGNAYQLQNATDDASAASATSAVMVVPGISSREMTSGQVSGSAAADTTGINIISQKSTDQLLGGYNNTQADRTQMLDGLVQSARVAANAVYDLNTGKWMTQNGAPPFLGSETEPVVAYARGTMDPVTGAIKEKIGFHETQLKGFGLLVVEIDNPDMAQFELSGQSTWTGMVVVVSNKNPQMQSTRLMQIGGNTGTAIIGGAFLYFRNEKRASDKYDLMSSPSEYAMISGNAAIKFSNDAINMGAKAKPSAMVVRSWRRLSENE